MRVAIVHDWLVTYAGAERVLEQMLACLPGADLYSLVDFLPDDQRDFLGGRPVHTSIVQRIPGARRWYRQYLPILTLAIESFDLSDYDLVVSSSHAVAKGVLTGPEQLHVCMCHSPPRYAWDLQHEYLREARLDRGVGSLIARWMLHRLRIWDLRTANGVDQFIANSDYIRRRIEKVYRRDATVIHPPVDVDAFTPGAEKGDSYLAVSRLVPYKRMELIVEAFRRMPGRRLIVVGDGPGRGRLDAMKAPNIELLGYQPHERVRELMQRARALVFAAQEDFGIVLVEAQACGTPVIAFGRGGSREIVQGLDSAEPTGLFFDRQTPEAIMEAVERFESLPGRFRPEACRANAERFAINRFRREFSAYIDEAWDAFQKRAR